MEASVSRTFVLKPKTCRQLEQQGARYLVPRLLPLGEKYQSRHEHLEAMERQHHPDYAPPVINSRRDWTKRWPVRRAI